MGRRHPERLEHIQRVAELAASWAERMGVPAPSATGGSARCGCTTRCAMRRAEELEKWAPDSPGPPELRHGPASAARAKAEGETDRGVLDAVRYHSLGLAEWDMVGRMLYCADYLEPGRPFDRERRAELAERLPDDPGRRARGGRPSPLTHLVESRMAASRAHGTVLEQSRRTRSALALMPRLVRAAWRPSCCGLRRRAASASRPRLRGAGA